MLKGSGSHSAKMATIIGEQLTLIDGEENKEYNIIVSQEDATRAKKHKCNIRFIAYKNRHYIQYYIFQKKSGNVSLLY